MPSQPPPKDILFSEHNIQVWQQNNYRYLDFGGDMIQSIIDVTKPQHLPSIVNRAMLAPLLFLSQAPKKVLLVGTGGGGLARYFDFFNIRGDAFEISASTIQIARQFFDFPKTNWIIHQQDAREFDGKKKNYDFIIFDIEVENTTPDWIGDPAILKKYKKSLSKQGILIINLITESEQKFTRFLANLRQIFNKQTLCMSIPEHQNIMLYGFRKPTRIDQAKLVPKIPPLTEQWQIEFSTFLAQMMNDNPTHQG
jgi:spermidine synthase